MKTGLNPSRDPADLEHLQSKYPQFYPKRLLLSLAAMSGVVLVAWLFINR